MDYVRMRQDMIASLRIRGITDEQTLHAIMQTPRHLFMESAFKHSAYEDQAWTIGSGQTISQPYIVARMTSLVAAVQRESVLEIGTGSGYQAAVLAHMFSKVFSVERIHSLSAKAEKRFESLGYKNIYCRYGDGMQGWPEWGPYNAIVCTAASSEKPTVLLDQLNNDGVLVIPMVSTQDRHMQHLWVYTKCDGKLAKRSVEQVSFVPILAGKS